MKSLSESSLCVCMRWTNLYARGCTIEQMDLTARAYYFTPSGRIISENLVNLATVILATCLAILAACLCIQEISFMRKAGTCLSEPQGVHYGIS